MSFPLLLLLNSIRTRTARWEWSENEIYNLNFHHPSSLLPQQHRARRSGVSEHNSKCFLYSILCWNQIQMEPSSLVVWMHARKWDLSSYSCWSKSSSHIWAPNTHGMEQWAWKRLAEAHLLQAPCMECNNAFSCGSSKQQQHTGISCVKRAWKKDWQMLTRDGIWIPFFHSCGKSKIYCCPAFVHFSFFLRIFPSSFFLLSSNGDE